MDTPTIWQRIRSEALRWLATTGPLAALMVLQSCSALAGAIPGGDAVAGALGGDTAASVDHDRLDRQIAALQCTPAAVHEEAVAERDAAKERAVALGLEIETLREVHARQIEQIRADHEAQVADLEAAIGTHAAAYHEALARAEAAEAALAEMKGVMDSLFAPKEATSEDQDE